MSRTTKGQLVALLVPLIGILGGIIAFHDSHATLFGFPMIFAWLFIWMPLTTVVLHVAWKIEEPTYDDIKNEVAPPSSGGGH